MAGVQPSWTGRRPSDVPAGVGPAAADRIARPGHWHDGSFGSLARFPAAQ